MNWIFWLIASYLYAHLYRFLHNRFQINIRGLGWLMRHIKRDLVLQVMGVKLYMYSPIAGSNAMQLINRWNEPETHRFLDALLDCAETPVTFIDVGANIGEMVIDMARKQQIESVHAFEPIGDCVHSIRASVAINAFENVQIHHTAVSDKIGFTDFDYSPTNPSCSGIRGTAQTRIRVPTTTLDYALPESIRHPILLLDVEGAEKDVLVGGVDLIKRERPLIIFEYNNVSRSHFNLEQIREVLGPEYEIFRLRQHDGLLDDNLEDTWNCVAVHRQTSYHMRCKSLIAGAGK
jgi:FkbM family methyltransferase